MALGAAVNAGTATVRLNSGTGLSQTAAGVITGANLGVRAVGDVTLDVANNNVSGTLAANNTGAGNIISFLDNSGFTVGTVPADTLFTAITGVTSNNGNITLGNLAGSQSLQAAVNAGTATVRLSSAGGVSQNAAGAIALRGRRPGKPVRLYEASASRTPGLHATSGSRSSSELEAHFCVDFFRRRRRFGFAGSAPSCD